MSQEPGACFEAQMASEGRDTGHLLDVFAVCGLHANDNRLTLRAIRSHLRKVITPHVFERVNGTAQTYGPNVPRWKHVNVVKERLSQLSECRFQALKTAWSGKSKQTWDPFQPVGSAAALKPPGQKRVLPSHYYATVEEVEDEDDRARRAPGTQDDPVDLDSTDPETETARSQTPPPPPPPLRPVVPASSQATPQKQRLVPRGILLGIWKYSGLHADLANAVYASRDRRNRINRRITKVSTSMLPSNSTFYDSKKTACSHKDIDYLPEYQGLSEAEVNSHIMPLLAAQERSEGINLTSPSAASPTARSRPAPQGSPTRAPRRLQVQGFQWFVDENGVTHQVV